VKDLRAEALPPRPAPVPRHDLPEDREADVRVVVAAAGPVPDRLRAELRGQVGPGSAGRALPPWALGLRLETGRVRQQLGDGSVAEGGAGHVSIEWVGEVEPTL